VSQRKVVSVAYNLLFGAAVQLRANQLQQQESQFQLDSSLLAPLKVEQIKEFLS